MKESLEIGVPEGLAHPRSQPPLNLLAVALFGGAPFSDQLFSYGFLMPLGTLFLGPATGTSHWRTAWLTTPMAPPTATSHWHKGRERDNPKPRVDWRC